MEMADVKKVKYGNNTLNLWQSRWVTSERGRFMAK